MDPEFGTGVVKVTPAHDPNDFEIGLRHGLEQIQVIGHDARMTEAAGPYAGLDRYECRKAVVRDLEAQGLLVKVEDHRHAVGQCYRCDTVVEPLVSKQWFVQDEAAGRAGHRGRSRTGRVRFVPERFTKNYLHWMENIRDWCISRQLWWGHRIPVWTARLRRPFAVGGGPDAVPELRQRQHRAGSGRAGHVVQLGPVAFLHAGLARDDRRTWSASTRPTCW